jgi:hypothetical protein
LSTQLVGDLALAIAAWLHYHPAFVVSHPGVIQWVSADFSWEVSLLIFIIMFFGFWFHSAYRIYAERDQEAKEAEYRLKTENDSLKEQLKQRDESPLMITAQEKIISDPGSTYPPARAEEERCQITVTNNSRLTVDAVKIELVDIFEPILRRQFPTDGFTLPLILKKKDGTQPGSLNPRESVSVDLFDATIGRNPSTKQSTVDVRIAHQGIIASLTIDANDVEFNCRLRVSAENTLGSDKEYRVKFSASTHRFTMSKVDPCTSATPNLKTS